MGKKAEQRERQCENKMKNHKGKENNTFNFGEKIITIETNVVKMTFIWPLFSSTCWKKGRHWDKTVRKGKEMLCKQRKRYLITNLFFFIETY
jgi:hypothetical protein